MKNQILKIEHLSHRYNQSWAISDINLEIDKTGIIGLLGSNGAGKSTTMNIICGVLNQTEGHVYIDGLNMRQHPEEAKMKIGFLPQAAPLYMDFTVDEYLMFCAQIRFIPKEKLKKSVEYAKERCGITNFGKRLISNLSGGYRQRVGIAQAIIHQPKLVILDEPTNGLDPNQIIEVRALIKEIAKERAVVFSSHILSEIQVLCDDITMIEGGKVVFAGTMQAFNNFIKPHSLLLNMINVPSNDVLQQISGIHKVEKLTENQIRIFYDQDQDIAERLIAISLRENWRLTEISFDKTSIDEIFAQLSNKQPIK